MFKVVDGKMKIMSKFIQLEDGVHDVYIDGLTGSIFQTSGNGGSSTGSRICHYTYNEDTGELNITGPGDAPIPAGSGAPMRGITAGNRDMISQTILYSDPDGYGPTMSVYLEGFSFLFTYTAFAHIVSAARPFSFASGRVCFDTMFVKTESSLQAMYFTALPTSLSCGSDGWDAYGQTSPLEQMYGLPGAAQQNAINADIFEYMNNRTSIAFFYRTTRKYMFFARNVGGIFSIMTMDGPLSIASGTDAPEADGDIGGFAAKSFQFSMFNLRQ